MNNLRRSIHDLMYGRQYNRILRLSFPNDDAPTAQLLVNKIDEAESMSRDFVITSELLSDDPDIQIEGKTTEGKYIRLNNSPGGWQKNAKGNPERLANPSAAEFSYASGVHGKFDDLKENYSIAVDKAVIPKKAKLDIEGLGARVADDTGGAIDDCHIDNFLATGKAVVKAWLKGGINGTKRRVKYLGASK